MSFSEEIRQQKIKETAGVCETCGRLVKNHMVIGHIIHGHSPEHNVLKNAKGYCLACETRYHLSHVDNPRVIGLTAEENDSVVWGRLQQVFRMNRTVFHSLIREYPQQWAAVQQRMLASQLRRDAQAATVDSCSQDIH